ncbi:ammonium transporter Rh type B isoform X2 [Cherax quadricarinatus]|uniref:ammonium transporter Rh type B isoform X2 n=1 Tax=Cherax quadricarinatus TaxID=27406 RepID=UPI00387E7333
MMMRLVRRVGWFVFYASLIEFAVMLVFIVFVRYDAFYDGTKWNYTSYHGHSTPNLQTFYPMLQDVGVMMVIGFGFLMTFLRRYGHSGLGCTLYLTALTLQLALLADGVTTANDGYITLNVISVVQAAFTCAAVLISVGATLGTTSPTQLLLMALLEVPIYQINAYIGYRILAVVDHGGTLFLWVYWPSFNGVVESGRSQGRAVINTYLSLSASTLAAFMFSASTHKQHKWTMVHIQNATLAGGVAVGAVAGLMIQPWGALLLGYFAGALSTLGYTHLQGWLQEKFGLHDTCGVHNLHGMPGLLSAMVSVGAAFFASEANYGKELYLQYPVMAPAINISSSLPLIPELEDVAPGEGRTAEKQAFYQALATLITLLMALTAGGASGLLLNYMPFDPMTWPQLYSDAPWWELPEEEEQMEEEPSNSELGKIINIQVGQLETINHPRNVKVGQLETITHHSAVD